MDKYSELEVFFLGMEMRFLEIRGYQLLMFRDRYRMVRIRDIEEIFSKMNINLRKMPFAA